MSVSVPRSNKVEGQDPLAGWLVFQQKPDKTLSALARPGKAIALEAQIEPWPATIARFAFQFLVIDRVVISLSQKIEGMLDPRSRLKRKRGWLSRGPLWFT